MVAHRGNLNYQDCRRTLTAGFDKEELDLLRDLGANSMPMSSGSSGSVPGTDLLTRQTKIVGSEATKTSKCRYFYFRHLMKILVLI